MWVWFATAWAAPCADVVDGRLTGDAALAFAYGKADLVDPGAVEPVACAMQAHPEWSLQVAVHSDSQGADTYNLRVTQARAEAVVAALVARGIAPERLVAAGFGETRPLAPNGTAAERAQNRRIELWVDRARWAEPPPQAPTPTPTTPTPAPTTPTPTPAPVDPCAPLAGCAARACTVAMPASEAAARAVKCLGTGAPALRDGASWFVPTASGVIEVTPHPDGAALRPGA